MKTKWGNWEFIKENLTLENKKEAYWIDLERCTNSAEVLDWIFQIRGKTWADPETLATMLDALNALLYPQTNLCGSGIGKTIDDIGQRLQG